MRKLVRELCARYPRTIRSKMGHSLLPEKPYSDLGEEILRKLLEYGSTRGGNQTAGQEQVLQAVRSGNNERVVFCAHLLDLMMPDFEQDLTKYYELQQHYMLFRFLQYPFLDRLLDNYVQPYQAGLKHLPHLDVLEYGSGIPYGLIHALRLAPEKIRSASLVDLDMIYLRFAEFLTRSYGAPRGLDLAVLALPTTDALPRLTRHHNFIFAKDVFEHMKNPEGALDLILQTIQRPAVGFFDIKDRGVKYFQHVTPSISHLRDQLLQSGATYEGEVGKLSFFSWA